MSQDTPEPSEPPTEDPRPLGLRGTDSLLLVNTGDGKGKKIGRAHV